MDNDAGWNVTADYWDSRSLSFCTAKCFLKICCLGTHKHFFKIVQNVPARVM